MLNTILLALAPVFFVMVLGYLAGKARVVDVGHADSINALVMDFALPASLFVATASASRAQMVEQAPLFAILGVVMLLLYFGWYFLLHAPSVSARADTSLQALTIAFPNLAGVGLPIASAVIGPRGAVPVAVAIAAGSILVTPLTLVFLEMHRNDASSTPITPTAHAIEAVGRALTRPVVLAPELGIVVALSGVPLGPIVASSLTLIGHAAAGVALFLTGLILSAQPFRLDWKVMSATAAANIARPGLTALVVLALPLSDETAKIAVLLAAAPSGFFGILFAVNYRLDSAESGSMVIASTVFSAVTLAVAIAILFPHL